MMCKDSHTFINYTTFFTEVIEAKLLWKIFNFLNKYSNHSIIKWHFTFGMTPLKLLAQWSKCGPEDNKSQDMSMQNPHRHALSHHLYLYINLMEWHTGRLQRRHLMPCQNITPVTVLPNFDRLPCQGMQRFMSPICLVLLTGSWVRQSGLSMNA